MSDQPAPRRIPAHDVATLRDCVAAAWAHGAISKGRVTELAESCGWDMGEMEVLKLAEEGRPAEAAA